MVTGVAVNLAASPALAATATPKPSPQPPPPSAIGQQVVLWLAISPAFTRSGVVVALASGPCPSGTCQNLWVSRDGGNSWHQAAAKNWNPTRFTIGVDAAGHETLYSGNSTSLMRSDDYGETWNPSGAGGTPSVLPTYPRDLGVAVAGAGGSTGDYVSREGKAERVAGSNGAAVDLQFLPAPTFPAGGTFHPALLAAMDPKSSVPEVLRCDASFSCSGATVLAGPTNASAMTSAGTYLLASADYAEHGSVFAATPVGIQKSLDGGATFTPLSIVPTAGAATTATPMMALAPGYREQGSVRTAYVAVFQLFQDQQQKKGHTSGGVYRTLDGGSTWTGIGTTGPFAGGAQAVAVAPDGRIFAGYYDGNGHGGLLCSTDGSTWRSSCPSIRSQSDTAGGAQPTASGCCGGQAGAALGGDANTGATAAAVATTPGQELTGTGRPAAASTSAAPGRTWWILAAILATGMGAAFIARAVLRRAKARRNAGKA